MKDYTWIVGTIATMLGIISTLIAYQKGLRTEGRNEGQEKEATIQIINNIKDDMKEIKSTMKEINTALGNWTERIIVLEESLKSVITRLETIEDRRNRNLQKGGE